MKKLLPLLAFASLGKLTIAREVGISFGDVFDNTMAIDRLFTVGEVCRVHAHLSFGHGVIVEALCDFLYRPNGGQAFNWYLGLGHYMLIDDPFYLGFSGKLAVHYHFNQVPVQVSAERRPTFWLIEETEFRGGGFGVNVRYLFGQ